jgi:anti-sigma regulatory factor (Ser/Thr protein kinase)
MSGCPNPTGEPPLHLLLFLRLPASPAAPGVARHAVSGLEPFLERSVLEDSELLVSELVTNSIRHSGLREPDYIEVKLQASGDALMVEVADCGRGFGLRRPGPGSRAAQAAFPEQTSGWGLFLVERIASRWGIVENDETRVWFELRPGLQTQVSAPCSGG